METINNQAAITTLNPIFYWLSLAELFHCAAQEPHQPLMTITEKPKIEFLSYIPAIDGLRAIAVLGVIFFHLQSDLLPGGFVGVDVFFVISGFLITRIILTGSEAGQFSFHEFYQRRIARIFPVFFAVLLATLVMAKLLYTPDNLSSCGTMAAASSLCIANLKLLFQGNYFEIEPDSQPLMHYWSLSVEEQFYAIVPLIIVLAYRFRVTRRTLLAATAVVTITSFAICASLTFTHPSFAFYLLPTRAWELLVGSLLAFKNVQANQNGSRWMSFAPWVGIVAILASYFLLDGETDSFPGFIALLPVLGGAALIAGAESASSPINRFLAMPPVVFVGKISYSLYLWHWPIYSFVDYRLFNESSAYRTSLKLGFLAVISTLSYFFIEKPSRKALRSPKLCKFTVVATVAVIAITTIGGIWIRRTNYVEAKFSAISSGGVVVNPERKGPSIVLMGDSYGSMYGRSFVALAKKMDFRGHVICQGSTTPFPGNDYYEESIAFIAAEKPKITVFAASWYFHDVLGKEGMLDAAIEGILQHSEYLVLIDTPPLLPKLGAREWIRRHGPSPIFESPEFHEGRLRANGFIEKRTSERVRIVQINDIFTNQDGSIRFFDRKNRQLYNDAIHLSGYGGDLVMGEAEKLIAELLRQE